MRFNKLKEEIAKKHQVAITDDDPVMLVATICQLFLDESKRLLERMEEEQRERFEQELRKREIKNSRYLATIAALAGIAAGIFLTLIISR
ncbi:hypothetical protein [Desulforhopalus singaporensis]|uniref:Transcriptional activator TraM n=1 Tax=Desulforhopalus singaporensis TaxID=91360 RepID=A0A1H0PAR4_9BACT|nr:hypothetical protein [Desulforhopalus singaporensis]SDP02172.1 Transcriptional activator TraM [Desulforhopalus singaporensis]